MPWAVEPTRRPDRSPSPPGSVLAAPAAVARAAGEMVGFGPVVGRGAVKALLDANSHLRSPAPRTILNQPITGARRFAAQSWPLERIRSVAGASGTTINDVVLAMCSSALRRYLSDLDALPDDPLVAMTPVSLREAGADVGGNAVGVLLADLATNLADPADRLEGIHRSMEGGKESLRSMSPTQAALASAAAMSPMVLGMLPGVRRVARPAFNLVISNIPGPTSALYWNGAELVGVYPLSIPADGQAFNITVTSYHGNLQFGLTGCRRTVPHLQRLLGHLDQGLGELEKSVLG